MGAPRSTGLSGISVENHKSTHESQSGTLAAYLNFVAWLAQRLARTSFEIAATSRRNCRPYRAEKEAPVLQKQAVFIAPAADQQPLTALAPLVAYWHRMPVGLCMSESSVWLIRHQPARNASKRVAQHRDIAGVRLVCRRMERTQANID